MPPQIPCDKCDGTGRRPLPRELGQTLLAVVTGYRTVEAIYAQDPLRHEITPSAINIRLKRLMDLDLVKREKGPGRNFHYTATAKARRSTPTKQKRKP